MLACDLILEVYAAERRIEATVLLHCSLGKYRLSSHKHVDLWNSCDQRKKLLFISVRGRLWNEDSCWGNVLQFVLWSQYNTWIPCLTFVRASILSMLKIPYASGKKWNRVKYVGYMIKYEIPFLQGKRLSRNILAIAVCNEPDCEHKQTKQSRKACVFIWETVSHMEV